MVLDLWGLEILKRALGIGSAYGDEFIPISNNIDHITILDPSDSFMGIENIAGTPCQYTKLERTGALQFENNSFELITSFGALHHIPNVSYVLSECCRCLKPEGIMLIREPISSMGDWRVARDGLTKRERGIPAEIFEEIIIKARFKIIHRALCQFSPLSKILNRFGINVFNSATLTIFDSILSKIFSSNLKYHRSDIFSGVAPSSIFYILSK